MRKAIVITNAMVGFLLIGVLILTFILPLRVTGSTLDSVTDFSSGWHYTNGSTANLMDLQFTDGKAIVSRTLAAPLDGKDLCFTSWNVEFSILSNGKKVYEFYPKLGGFYGKFYGNQEQMVMLPSSTKEITFIFQAKYDNPRLGVEKLVLQDSGSHVLSLLRENSHKFVTCVITFFIGIALFLLGLFEETMRREDMVETMSLGAISMVLSLWASFSTHVVQIISGNFASSRMFEHMTLMLLPIPVLIFVGSMTHSLHSRLLRAGLLVSILNFLMQFLVVFMGLWDFSELLYISHIIIVAGIVLVAFMVTHAVRKQQISLQQTVFLVTALSIVFIAGLIDMVRFYHGITEDPAHISRIGLFLFVLMLTIYEFRQLIRIQVRIGEAEVMHRLAMEDALTGLQNRTAFNKYEQEIAQKTNGRCLFVQLDVNYLKKVNDTYGHADGDRHLIAAANLIRDTFGQYGTCYRVGGDEFFAILDGADCERDYERALAAFRTLQRQYNEIEHPKVPMQIACGMAVYDFKEKNPEAAEKLADSRMYENKKMLKLAKA